VADQTNILDELGDLTAANVVLQSQARDAKQQLAGSKDELEGHQMSRADPGQGG
jgi:hypothetical protein